MRHRQGAGVDAAEISIKRRALRGGGGARHRHRDGEHRVCAEVGFVRRAVEIDHDLVDLRLQGGIVAMQRFGDRSVDIGDGFANAFAEIALLIVVAQFDGFVFAGGSAARDGGAAVAAIGEKNFGFDCRISPRIQNFSATYSDDG